MFKWQGVKTKIDPSVAQLLLWITRLLLGRRFERNGPVAPYGLPDLILASSQFLVRKSHENKCKLATACGSLA
jgi:hypothetical protein